jgi:hypothetical protein
MHSKPHSNLTACLIGNEEKHVRFGWTQNVQQKLPKFPCKKATFTFSHDHTSKITTLDNQPFEREHKLSKLLTMKDCFI